MKTYFCCYVYPDGAEIWFLVDAESVAEIEELSPNIRAFVDKPIWMTDKVKKVYTKTALSNGWKFSSKDVELQSFINVPIVEGLGCKTFNLAMGVRISLGHTTIRIEKMIVDAKAYPTIHALYMFINDDKTKVTVLWDDKNTTCKFYGRLKDKDVTDRIGIFQCDNDWLIIDLYLNRFIFNY